MKTGSSQAEHLLLTLFDPTDRVEIRTIGKVKGAARKVFFDSYGEVVFEWEAIERWNEKANIYFGVNPRTGRKGTDDDVDLARCVFVDIDGLTDHAEAVKRLEGLPTPTATVMSGGGFHFYWVLSAPVTDMVHWRQMMKALIKRCGADPSVHNPSRIMRLPGTSNLKDGRGKCVLLDFDPSRRYGTEWIEALGIPEPESIGERVSQNILNAKWQTPTRATLEWINRETPHPEGGRNQRLFNAAVELLGNGWDQGVIIEACGKAAARDGLTDDEINQTLESALSKPRNPSPNNLGDREPLAGSGSPQTKQEGDEGGDGPTEQPDTVAVVCGPHTAPTLARQTLMNTVYTRSQAEDGKMRHFYKPIEMLAQEIRGHTGGWPKKVGGFLVVKGTDPGDGRLPGSGYFRYILNADQFVAWLYEISHLHWHTGQAFDAATNEPRSAVSKREFFEYMQSQTDEYEGFSLIPHEPPMPQTLYASITLPDAPTGRLDELIATTNGETDQDRDLIKAMIMTAVWGGDAGTRPMFVLRSQHGRGTGKTVTSDIVAHIAGMALQTGSKEKWQDIAKRLFSPSSMQGRVVQMDNIKGRLSNEELEAAITSTVIEGHMMYKGNARRPNTLTWIVTSNTPNMSTDLAVRSVIIDIGASKHANTGYKEWVKAFCYRHRAELLADCVAWLSQPPRCKISPQNADRFGSWARAILTRFDNGDELASKIIASRAEVDGEGADMDDMADYIRLLLKRHGIDPDQCSARITRKAMGEWLRDGCSVDLNMRGIATMLRDGKGHGPLRPLGEVKYQGQRCWAWNTGGDGYRVQVVDRVDPLGDAWAHGGGADDIPM